MITVYDSVTRSLTRGDPAAASWVDVVAPTEAEARTAAYLLVETGTENVAILAGGWPAFAGTVLSTSLPVDEGRYAPVVERFREQARVALAERVRLERAAGTAAPKKVKKVQGGC